MVICPAFALWTCLKFDHTYLIHVHFLRFQVYFKTLLAFPVQSGHYCHSCNTRPFRQCNWLCLPTSTLQIGYEILHDFFQLIENSWLALDNSYIVNRICFYTIFRTWASTAWRSGLDRVRQPEGILRHPVMFLTEWLHLSRPDSRWCIEKFIDDQFRKIQSQPLRMLTTCVQLIDWSNSKMQREEITTKILT